jgi:ATP-binding cassette subfamily B protein
MHAPATEPNLASHSLVANQAAIRKFTDQPERLPAEVRARVEAQWQGGQVQLYALADLDDAFLLKPTWVLLGEHQIAFVPYEQTPSQSAVKSIPALKKNGAAPPAPPIEIHTLDRAKVTRVREVNGLSCNELHLLGGTPPAEPGKPAPADQGPVVSLRVLRYSKRQQRALENIKFVLEESIKGTPVAPENPDSAYAETVAGAIREAQATISHHELSVLWRLLAYLKPYRKNVIIGTICAIILTLCNMVPPYITGEIIKTVELQNRGVVQQGNAAALAWNLLWLVGGVLVIREIATFIRFRKMAYLGESVAHDLRRDLYNHLQTLSLKFFSKKQTGSIISRVSSDTDRLWDFIAFGVVEVALSAITLIGLAGVLIWLDWQLGLILVVPIPFFLYAFYWHGKSMNKLFLRGWRHWSNLTAVLSDTIPGMRVVKAFSQEQRETARFSDRNDTVTNSFNDVHRSWTTFWPTLMMGFHIVNLLVWIVALPRLLGVSGPPLDSGTFVKYMLYMVMFFQPLEVIGQMTRMMNRAVSSAHRVFEILDTEPQIIEVRDAKVIPEIKGHLRFDNVSFSYDGIRRVLRNVSFEIQPGEMIGLVGPSGAGKTTITNLLARFYEATDGEIYIDGIDVRELELGPFRTQLGMVLQEAFLFHGTIVDNIRYGLPGATFEDVVEAARAANAHDFISKLPLGYETVVGERGHTLSGGERQRVSIARAILHNPRILILDEATSNVDTETERKIQEALDRLIAGRTVVAIAHRLSTLLKADRLIVIKDGKLVEEGTHKELLAIPDGVYKKLHNMQLELSSNVGV